MRQPMPLFHFGGLPTMNTYQQNYQQEVFSFISSVIGQKNVIPVPVEFIHFTGDANTAMLLTQIIYWTDRAKDPDGWFYKSYEQWEDELALNQYFARKAINALKNMGIIETKIKKIENGDTHLHFKLNKEIFIELFGVHLQKRQAIKKQKATTKEHKKEKEKQAFAQKVIMESELHNFGNSNFALPDFQTLHFPTSKLCTSFHYTEPITETTTTEPKIAVVAVNKEIQKAEQKDSNSKSKLELLIKLIPSKHQTPLIIKFLEQKLNDGVDVDELKACILYVKDKAKGNSSQFKSYLGKCLDQKWATGILEEFEAERLKKEGIEAQEAMRAFLEAQERQARLEAQAKAKADDDEINAILETVDIADLDKFVESPEIWKSINSFEQKSWKRKERYITRRLWVKKYLQHKLLGD